MDNFESVVVCTVKFETLLRGIGFWIPENPDIYLLQWINVWMGPHWILVPQGDGIMIQREGYLVYEGRFRDFPNSEAALNHQVDLKMLDGHKSAYFYEIATDFTRTLQGWITPSLPAPEIHKRVQKFFEFYKAKASSWSPEISIDVVIVKNLNKLNFVWSIKRCEKDNSFMGWAMGDGTFTIGVEATQESIRRETFTTKQHSVKFAQEHNWNVVGFIE